MVYNHGEFSSGNAIDVGVDGKSMKCLTVSTSHQGSLLYGSMREILFASC